MHYRCTIFAKVGEGCLACKPDIVSRGPRPACSVTRRSSGREDDDNHCDEDDYFLHGADQGGRTWQPFVGSKNGNENFRQARIYNFCVKCVVFARNRKFAKLTQ